MILYRDWQNEKKKSQIPWAIFDRHRYEPVRRFVWSDFGFGLVLVPQESWPPSWRERAEISDFDSDGWLDWTDALPLWPPRLASLMYSESLSFTMPLCRWVFSSGGIFTTGESPGIWEICPFIAPGWQPHKHTRIHTLLWTWTAELGQLVIMLCLWIECILLLLRRWLDFVLTYQKHSPT